MPSGRYTRQRRRVVITASACLTLSFLATTTNAFILPKMRTRAAPNTLAVMSMTEDKTEKGKEILNELGKSNGQKAPLPIDLLNGEHEEPEDTYEIHVGRALDILRKDYPHILTDQPGT